MLMTYISVVLIFSEIQFLYLIFKIRGLGFIIFVVPYIPKILETFEY